MPVAVILGIVVIVIAVLLAHAALAIIAAHMAAFILAAGIGIPAVAAITFAVLRGAHRHTVLVYNPLERPRRPALPAPVEYRAIAPSRVRQQPDPFSAGPAAWDDMIAETEADELNSPGPREARVILVCESRECKNPLDEYSWEIVVEGDGDPQLHRFCSRECTEEWQREDQESRLSQ